MEHRTELPYFTEEELACPSSGTLRIDSRAAAQLPYLRVTWGAPLYLNSACRSPAHNAKVGGHKFSLHLTENPKHPTNGCMAFDIRWRSMGVKDKLELARLCWKLGWALGFHDGFLHIDRRVEIGLPKIIFLYDEWAAPFSREDVKYGSH